MAKNSRMIKLSDKKDEYAFSWKLLAGWDFMIGNSDTANNKIASNILSLKEALLEDAENKKKLQRWKITSLRITVNLFVTFLFIISAYAVIEVVQRSTEINSNSGWWRQNEITVVMSLISYIFPIFFEILGILENYHPRKQLRLQLARIMVLNLLNLYSLIFALFDKISHMEVELQKLKPKIIELSNPNNSVNRNCRKLPFSCMDVNISNPLPKLLQLSSNILTPFNTTLSIAAMNLIMNNKSIKFSVDYDILSPSRINDIPDEYLAGVYENMDYDPSTFFNISVSTIDKTIATFHMIKQNEYVEKNLPYSYFEYYDSGDIFNNSNLTAVTEAHTNQNTVKTTNIAKILKNEEYLVNLKKIYRLNNSTMVEIPATTTNKDHEIIKKLNVDECFINTCDISRVELYEKDAYENRKDHQIITSSLNTAKKKLRKLCWETMFGQELAKLTVMDLILTVITTLAVDLLRSIFVRYMNSWWCWDLEIQFPQYGDFKIAENILHLVNNQGMVWMGMFFSPGLIMLNLFKIGILMYLRSWTVMTCNVPHETVFHASKSNNFYLSLLLTMLFLCVLPVAYAIVWVEPSWHCGPFSGYYRIYNVASRSLKDILPKKIYKALDYVFSPGIIIPLLVLMVLIIYYMVSLTGSLREANNDLKNQLRYERTEERRKMFKIAANQGQEQRVSSIELISDIS